MICDFVRSYKDKGEVGCLSNKRCLNVMLIRKVLALIVVGESWSTRLTEAEREADELYKQQFAEAVKIGQNYPKSDAAQCQREFLAEKNEYFEAVFKYGGPSNMLDIQRDVFTDIIDETVDSLTAADEFMGIAPSPKNQDLSYRWENERSSSRIPGLKQTPTSSKATPNLENQVYYQSSKKEAHRFWHQLRVSSSYPARAITERSPRLPT